MLMMFSWLKYLKSFISRKVLKQNILWSKGVIFLIATFWPEGLCKAELDIQLGALLLAHNSAGGTLPNHTVGTFTYNI
jgi:hypothetical protein